MQFIDELNESQRAAVAYNDGPLLVIAGAGSGKTRVLTYKIAYLLTQGVPAGHILALTFTNKAAREMKQRIIRLVGEDVGRYLWMGTFHSICSRMLRAEAEYIGFTRDFTIYDAADQKSLVKKIVKDLQLDDKIYRPGAVLERISAAKSAFIFPEAYAQNEQFAKIDRLERLYKMPSVYAEYNRRLKEANAMDFDDLLMYTVLLLRNNAEVRERYQQRFWHVLVDEYQDTNHTQYLIVKLLAEPQNHICVVGDDAQSIYSFRGATIENILTFQNGYTGAKLFKLERNYRSTQNIVNAANSLIHKNKGQIYKEVYSEKEAGERLHLTGYSTDREESAAVARQILGLHRLNKRDYEGIAILYRTNSQSRNLEEEMRKLGIPYRIYGGTSFYQRKEIKDAIAYFRLAANNSDNEALERIANVPKRSIGDTTVSRVREAALRENVSMLRVMQSPQVYAAEIAAATQRKLQAFAEMIGRFTAAMQEMNAFDFAQLVLNQSGLMADAAMDVSAEGVDRKANLEELLSGIRQYVDDRTAQNEDTRITDFIHEVSLLTDQDEGTDDTTSRVTMMTVHAAKGLEFPVVFIVGLEENLFPSPFCQTESDLEEERRLLYVAITRAEQECYLTYASQRWKNGQVNFSNPSRFLKDIDRQYIQQLSAVSTQPSPWTEMPIRSSWGETAQRSPWGERPAPSSRGREQSTPVAARSLKPTTGLQPKATVQDSVSTEWKQGDRVDHKVFGQGTVQRVYRENDNEKIEIEFDTKGTKTLLLAYAKLDRCADRPLR
ncbi:MAG: UvrD-helicase domain-containing protein [Paludibacteraceae bacterium]|nr:UvrD-helicase domain-containing protein [Paludibacteraceae bacterium]